MITGFLTFAVIGQVMLLLFNGITDIIVSYNTTDLLEWVFLGEHIHL